MKAAMRKSRRRYTGMSDSLDPCSCDGFFLMTGGSLATTASRCHTVHACPWEVHLYPSIIRSVISIEYAQSTSRNENPVAWRFLLFSIAILDVSSTFVHSVLAGVILQYPPWTCNSLVWLVRVLHLRSSFFRGAMIGSSTLYTLKVS